jgi:flagellar hook-associated protein 3
MDIRVTQASMVNQAIASARQATARLADLQSQASTGKKLRVPSDNPADVLADLAARSQDLRLGTYLDNINASTSALDASVSALRDASDLITQARQIAIEGSNGGNTPDAQESLAAEVDQLLNRLVDTANTRDGQRYLFAGGDPQTAPFRVAAVDAQGRPQSVVYQGGSADSGILIGPQRTVTTTLPGDSVFQTAQRGQTTFSGSTGAAPGTGTDSATGQGTLQVRHTSTTYAAGSGVAAATGSAVGDTVLGPAGANHLTIVDTSGTGAAGTVSLNGGPDVAFTNTDTNLQVNGPKGEKVFVDTTAITAGFNGTVAITANGTLSVDGGASTVPINFSSNQVVTNSSTGAVTNVDSTNISTTGDDRLEYAGTYDAFQILMALRDDLRNKAGLADSDQTKAIAGRIGELDRVQTALLGTIGTQSASLQHLQNLQSHDQDMQLAAQKATSDLEGADISSVVVQLQQQQNQLQLTLAATARVMSVSLLDFLH